MPTEETDAFSYFTAPENTMGVQSQKFIKWNYFWQLFKQHSDWDLEYDDGGGWISCKEDLIVNKERNEENSSEKITLDFTASHTADYRLTFAIDRKVKDYIVKLDDYKYELNYKVGEHEGEDEIYSVFFDWSDIVSIPGIIISHGMTVIEGDDYFWFRARKNGITEGAHIEIDPAFGHEVGESTRIGIGYWIGGSIVERMLASTYANTADSTLQSMSAYVATGSHALGGDNGNCLCAIYDSDDNSLVAKSESRNITGELHWETFSIGPSSISNGKSYILGVYGDAPTVDPNPGNYTTFIKVTKGGSGGPGVDYDLINDYPTINDPFDDDGTLYAGQYLSVYCTYAGAGSPEETFSDDPDVRISSSKRGQDMSMNTSKQGQDMFIQTRAY